MRASSSSWEMASARISFSSRLSNDRINIVQTGNAPRNGPDSTAAPHRLQGQSLMLAPRPRRVKLNVFTGNPAAPTGFRVSWKPRTVPKWDTQSHRAGRGGGWGGEGGGKEGGRGGEGRGKGGAPVSSGGPSSVPFCHKTPLPELLVNQ